MRKLMIAVTAVAGVAMASGCSKRDNVEEQRQDVAEARQEAQQETAEIRQDMQQDIAENQREAHEEIASTQQEVQEERQELNQAQSNQQEEMAEGGSGMAGTSAQTSNVDGRVLSTGGDSLTLVDTSNNKQLKLKTNDQTRIMKDNKQVKLDDITEGAQVRASYVMEGKDMVAKELTVTQPVQKKQ